MHLESSRLFLLVCSALLSRIKEEGIILILPALPGESHLTMLVLYINTYSCCPEVSIDAKNLASWQGPSANIYVYLVVYFTTSYIYHYFIVSHGNEIDLELRSAVATCRLLYNESFKVIKRKTRINSVTAATIMRRVIDRADSEDFNEVLAYLSNINRPKASIRIEDQSDLFKLVRQAFLKHPRSSR